MSASTTPEATCELWTAKLMANDSRTMGVALVIGAVCLLAFVAVVILAVMGGAQ